MSGPVRPKVYHRRSTIKRVILSDFESDRKIFIMDQMLKHYEEKEDFEKCKVIFEIKKQIEIENRC